MLVEQWPIERVRPYADNPRRNAGAVDKVAASLQKFGWRQPLVVDTDGMLIVGHTRLLAAQQLGYASVPVHVASNLTAELARAYRLADNRTAEYAEWDYEKVAAELQALADLGGDELLRASMFSDADLSNLLGAEFTPAPLSALPSRDHLHTVSFSDEQWAAVHEAIEFACSMDPQLTSTAAALEAICRTYRLQ